MNCKESIRRLHRFYRIESVSDGKIVVGGSDHNGSGYDFALERYFGS